MAAARFVTLEGIEGSGKSTQARRLAAALKRAGQAVTVTREPGGSPGADAIRSLLLQGANDGWTPLAETLLHYAARCEHLHHTVRPALAAGRWVVSDRYADSTMAYQGYAQGVDRDAVLRLHAVAAGGLWPDLTLILDLDVAVGLHRARARSPDSDRYERMDADFHQRVRDGFLDIARRSPERCVVIDATEDEDAVAGALAAAVSARLGIRL